MPNAYVSNMVGANGKLYLFGPFSYFGPNTGNAYPISKTTGEPLDGYISSILPDVTKIISDGNGGWYIGGYFKVTNVANSYSLIHVNSDGSLDTNFNAQMSSATVIEDLILHNGVLYVAGAFSAIGGQTRYGVASLDPATGTATS